MGELDNLVAPSLALDVCFDKPKKIGPRMELAHKEEVVQGARSGVVRAEGDRWKGLRSHFPHAGLLSWHIVWLRGQNGESAQHKKD